MDNDLISRRLWPPINSGPSAAQPNPTETPRPEASPAPEAPLSLEDPERATDEAPAWDRPADYHRPTEASDPDDTPWDRPAEDWPDPQFVDDAEPGSQDPDDAFAPIAGDIRRGAAPTWPGWPPDRPVFGGAPPPPRASDDSSVVNREADTPTGPPEPSPVDPASVPARPVGQWIVSTPTGPGMPQALVLRIEVAIVDASRHSAAPAPGTPRPVRLTAAQPPWVSTSLWGDGTWETADPLSSLPAAPAPMLPAGAANIEVVEFAPTVAPAPDAEGAGAPSPDEREGWRSTLVTAVLTLIAAIIVVALVLVFVQLVTPLLR